MSRSWKRKRREALGKAHPVTERAYDIMTVLADIIDATPPGQRSPVMQKLLDDVRGAEAAHPVPVGGGR